MAFVILADYDRPVSRTGGEAGGWNMALCVKGIYGYRNFVLQDGEGTDVVRAESMWFLYDTDKNIPIRVRPGIRLLTASRSQGWY